MTGAVSHPGANATPRRDDAADDVGAYRWLILFGLITAAIMEVLDSTIVNVALPQMAGNLGATIQEIAWVSTGYILSNVVVLPMTAFFTATFGRRIYLSASILIFIVASFLCGTSHSLGEIVLWRVMQGAGGAALLSTAQATVRQIFPLRQQGVVQAVFLLGIIVAPTLGPTLGGWITDNYTWNWCFFINVPVGLVSVSIVFTFLKDPPGMKRRTGPVDLLGIGLLALGLACLQYVLEEGEQDDWFADPWIMRLTVVSVVSLISMVWWELTPRNRYPIVDFRVLRSRDLAVSCALFVTLGFGLYGGTFIFPLLAQNLLGFSPTNTGLALLPGGLGTAGSVLVCGKLLSGDKPLIDSRMLIYCGMAVFCWSMWRMGHLDTSVGEPEVRAALLLRGIGLGLLFAPINNTAFTTVDPKDAQQASGLINLSRQIGGSFGVAMISTYLADQIQYHRVNLIGAIHTGNPALATRLSALAAKLVAHGYSPPDAQHAALGLIDNDLTRQATMMAYNNCWIVVLLTFVVASPAVLLLRKPKPAKIPGGEM